MVFDLTVARNWILEVGSSFRGLNCFEIDGSGVKVRVVLVD